MITRPTVPRSSSIVADLSVVMLLAAILYGLLRVAKHWQVPLQPRVEIDLSLWALPLYTLCSLLRGFAAYGLSLGFAITYGYLAASSPRAERILIPLLDIFQSIPVLGFLPGAVLALVTLFPRTNAGLELASILMIFTGQVWNMAFSFYQSLRGIPSELREASALYQFNWWQRFRRVEFPAAAIGLAWNSMMAMAGGWFFLMVCEAFTLGSYDFRLPGLGAYMSVATARHDLRAMGAGAVAMVLMIILVDTCVWRPVLVWAHKFKLEETAADPVQGSFVLRWLQHSWLVHEAMTRIAHPVSEWLAASATRPQEPVVPMSGHRPRRRAVQLGYLAAMAGGSVLVIWGCWHLVHLLSRIPLTGWSQVLGDAALTFARVFACVVLGSAWTIPAGLWIGQSERRRSRLQPLVQVAASFPAPMLYPVILLGLRGAGVGLGFGAVLLMAVGTQWYILFNVIAGVSSVPAHLREVARAYQFTPRQQWQKLWWPAMFPYLVTGWITAAGGAWNASIVAEYVPVGGQVSVAQGVGSRISLAASQGHYDVLAASVMVMALVVLLLNRYLWKPLYRMAQIRYAL